MLAACVINCLQEKYNKSSVWLNAGWVAMSSSSQGWWHHGGSGGGDGRSRGRDIAVPGLYTQTARDLNAVGISGCVSPECPCHFATDFMTVTSTRDLFVGDLFTLKDFHIQRPYAKSYSAHNTALKWLRHVHTTTEDIWLPMWIEVGEIEHYEGEHFTFRAEKWYWSWTQMIAGLDEKSMQIVVTGEVGRSRGINRCLFSKRPNSYDDISSRALRKAKNPSTCCCTSGISSS